MLGCVNATLRRRRPQQVSADCKTGPASPSQQRAQRLGPHYITAAARMAAKGLLFTTAEMECLSFPFFTVSSVGGPSPMPGLFIHTSLPAHVGAPLSLRGQFREANLVRTHPSAQAAIDANHVPPKRPSNCSEGLYASVCMSVCTCVCTSIYVSVCMSVYAYMSSEIPY